jgi:hypothetical protein
MAFRSTAIERMLGTGKEKVQRFKGRMGTGKESFIGVGVGVGIGIDQTN